MSLLLLPKIKGKEEANHQIKAGISQHCAHFTLTHITPIGADTSQPWFIDEEAESQRGDLIC